MAIEEPLLGCSMGKPGPMVLESEFPRIRQVSATARRHGISRPLVLNWRRSFQADHAVQDKRRIDFVTAVIASEPEVPVELAVPSAIEIEFASRARMRITGAVDRATLSATVAALTDGRLR
jgi:transposase